MSPSEPSQENFKITDRRRRVDPDEEAAAPVTAHEPAPPEPARAARPEAPRAVPSPPESTAPGPGAADRNLAGLFVMLASSAAVAIGDAPDPLTGQVQRDLAQAGELIDLLALLQQKTEGNRTAEETQILDDLLYDLQLRYVAATKRPGQARGPSRP